MLFFDGADEHMYIATLGVGIQHFDRGPFSEPPLDENQTLCDDGQSFVERPPGPVMNVDIWACPNCGTVAAFEGKVLAGDSDNLYVLNPDLSILEVHPQIDAKRILVAQDFAIQQHGTFDMAFVVQLGGKVSLVTYKALRARRSGRRLATGTLHGNRRILGPVDCQWRL